MKLCLDDICSNRNLKKQILNKTFIHCCLNFNLKCFQTSVKIKNYQKYGPIVTLIFKIVVFD